MANSMATMQGCGEDCVAEPCYACPCLVGDTTIRLVARVPYLELENPPEENPDFWGNPELLAGIFNLNGSLNGLCAGCWMDDCVSESGNRPKFVYQICPGGVGDFRLGYPMWAVTMNTVTGKVDVYLTWNAQTDCDNSLFVDNVTYIRWPFEFPSNTCDDVKNLVWTGEVYVNNTMAAGGLLEGCCTCPSVVDEFSAAEDDLLRYLHPLGSDPDVDAWWKLINIFTPPELYLDVAACVEPDCCATEGGAPTASISVEQGVGCNYTITDTSTAGTCGPIVRRLLEVLYFEIDDEVRDCPIKKKVHEFGEEDEYHVGGDIVGCTPGGVQIVFRMTVWDEAGCSDTFESEPVECCNCVDGETLCASPSGTLNITLIDEETCTYELCASIPEQSAYCGSPGTSFIEYQLSSSTCDFDECECDDVGTDDCTGVNCSGGLVDGGCTEISLEGPITIRWRVWDRNCGCYGDWNYEELPCNNCDCCEEPVRVFITLAGWTAQAGITCPCDNINGTWELTKSSSGTSSPCEWELQTEDWECPPSGILNLFASFVLSCFEGTLNGSLSTSPIGVNLAGEIIGTDCTLLGAAMTEQFRIENLCEGGTVSISLVAA